MSDNVPKLADYEPTLISYAQHRRRVEELRKRNLELERKLYNVKTYALVLTVYFVALIITGLRHWR